MNQGVLRYNIYICGEHPLQHNVITGSPWLFRKAAVTVASYVASYLIIDTVFRHRHQMEVYM